MGVYIKGMKMPESCEMCPIEGCEYINGKFTCPLIKIVTCGECKWGNKDNEGTLWCEHAIGGIMKPTDFCSYGERETEDFNPYQGERDRDENGEIY